MTITKKDFMENVKVEIKDYRTQKDKEKEKVYRKVLSANWYRKTYFVSVATMKEFFWIFHERIEEFPDISYLDGERRCNIVGNVYIPKRKYKNSYLISIDSRGEIHINYNGGYKDYKAKNCKEVIRLGRMIRDMME